MRILTVSHFYEDHGGGIERVAGHLCRQFTELGIQAAWAASDADQPPVAEVEAVPLACVNPIEKIVGLPMPLPGARAIRALAREVRRSDAVVVHDALYVTSILALLMAKAYRKRVVLIQHIAGIPFSSRTLRSLMALANIVITRPMLGAVDALVFISDTVRHDLVGTPARVPYRLLFNGVDSAIFHPAEGPAPILEAPMDTAVSSGMRRALFVGRYVEKKGLAVLRALAASRQDLTFLMVGSGPIRPSQWGLANVHDLGAQSPQALADLYRGVDLLLLPSVGEGFPLVIQEAMACGLPVVCGEPSNRADPGAAEWLRGVAIDLTDPEGSARRCADTIDSLAFASVERAAMARYALARYDWRAMARGVLTLTREGRTEL
ncbi:glycosyltransferase family 1 protein [Mesorhizobium sp. M1C.F.Ca.ET.193.01.1.1]|uniref:glycosyltransferase family 4 protein n=2 Tax=Mesorhizobium TaxID=68287 RepID=UPI000FD4AFDE|nr:MULTISPECIES: glycosyltransferase family 4 protein [unclassified Mesorhizobium]TGS93927.1 glycosyltransferase family 1 protein [bacterium M00.F.Ca.ET.177.01.1.1]TGQ50992.1 glycosyltransferase family 1 protein [Mesorhizobium sp. M1C.F.Ca.ET.210.01.1.1]TGQ66429.1 glycosyltransferase family 1 protein [Mesorhizobium sp. M1C.F.Ca.ET.212.01.1.1]TGR00515.1 glycosyltransferase family 1 protein [Mesorhizobium sp. M1C.F.Ca.ET.204.01.1.1]TGR21106.1 glycosyltransferase family 1 protein [Mesorhizobium s